MDDANQQRALRKAFSDISKGYSEVLFDDKRLFIKHLSHHEQVTLDVLYQSFLAAGIKEGLPTQKYIAKSLADEGVWTKKDDDALEEITKIIERLVAGKRVIHLKSDLERQNEQIKQREAEYHNKKSHRDKIFGLTAEVYAERKVNEYYIIESFFEDKDCNRRYLSEEYFDDFSEGEMQRIIKLYNSEMEIVSDANIKWLALQEFFQVYWSLSGESLYNFFGRPICDLTYFQIKLGSYGRTFKQILEKADGYPEDVKKDPDKLLDYVQMGENAKQVMEKAATGSPQNESVASTVFGAKKEEMQAVGLENTPGTTSLSAELKRKQAQGKRGLNMHDLMSAMGV
jgi:hypothetical protein